MPWNQGQERSGRTDLRAIAASTLKAVDDGSYELNGTTYDLRGTTERCKAATHYSSPESNLSSWASATPTSGTSTEDTVTTKVAFEEISTLEGTREVAAAISSASDSPIPRKIGVLNFASAKNEGGGFINGAQAQEESLARSSNIYASLTTEAGQRFYRPHRRDPAKGYYSHAMIYTPGVVFFRADKGEWLEPLEADVLTSCAVNAGAVRREVHGEDVSQDAKDELERRIENVMRERMGRVLYLFEKNAVTDVVLGSFGTGVFRNDVPTVGKLWGELIGAKGARYEKSFRSVFFAVLGHKTFEDLQEGYRTGSRISES